MSPQQDMGEYYFKLRVSVHQRPRNNILALYDVEEIAMLISALMNSSGGVLSLTLDSSDSAPGVNLDTCIKEIARVIQQHGNSISERIFKSCVICKSRGKNEIQIFVNKASQLVTLCSSAHSFTETSPVPISDSNELAKLVMCCLCEGKSKCEHHEDAQQRGSVISGLTDTKMFQLDQPFPVSDFSGDYCLYKNYQLNERLLADVLSTPSVQCEILELVSALANTNGGNIFVGVTNSEPPITRGYMVSKRDERYLKTCISKLLTGGNTGPRTIWANSDEEPKSYWDVFFHPLSSADCQRKVVEIRVNECPGGMFCALPECFDITAVGQVVQLKTFAEWKKRLIQTTVLTQSPESNDFGKHFKEHENPKEKDAVDLSSESAATPGDEMSSSQQSSPEFPWWIPDDDVRT